MISLNVNPNVTTMLYLSPKSQNLQHFHGIPPKNRKNVCQKGLFMSFLQKFEAFL